MGHRRLFSTPELFEMDHDQNPNPLLAEHSYVHFGRTRAADNGSSVFPVENMSGGINFPSQRQCSNEYSSSNSSTESSHRNSGRRSNEYCSPCISMELPHYQATTSGPTYDPLPHPTADGSSWPVPPNYSDQPSSSSSHYRHVNHGISGGSVNHTVGDLRGSCKRKRPPVSVINERGSTSRYSNAASATDVSVSSDLQTEKPQHWPWDPMSSSSRCRGSSLSIPGEGSQRNVRSRSALDLELNLPRPHVPGNPPGSQVNVRSRTTLGLDLTMPPHVSSNPSHHLRSTGRPINQNDTLDFAGMTAAATNHQWNYIPVSPAAQGRLIASDTSGFDRAPNQLPVGSSSSTGTLEIGGYNNDLTSRRTPAVPPQNLHVPPMQAVRGGHSSYAQRALPAYGATSSHPHVGYVPTSENGMHSMSEIYSRHLRPFPIMGWRRSDRSERSGVPYHRLHSPSDELVSHDRHVTEGLTMFDRSAMYGSRSLLDQHRDMRLDIDNMSYEELLDLGERIGTVSTGLSEDLISKCLFETICCSVDHSQDEGTCVICLEEYKNNDVIGTLMNCRHDYHIGCIRKWLSMKNMCPICKAPALKEK